MNHLPLLSALKHLAMKVEELEAKIDEVKQKLDDGTVTIEMWDEEESSEEESESEEEDGYESAPASFSY